jgi:hypothetical protein
MFILVYLASIQHLPPQKTVQKDNFAQNTVCIRFVGLIVDVASNSIWFDLLRFDALREILYQVRVVVWIHVWYT